MVTKPRETIYQSRNDKVNQQVEKETSASKETISSANSPILTGLSPQTLCKGCKGY